LANRALNHKEAAAATVGLMTIDLRVYTITKVLI